MERGAFANMPRGAVEPIKQVGATRAWQLALGSVHEAVQDERVVRTEQLGHLHLLRHAGLADPLEDVVLGYVAPERQRATLRRNGLYLRAQRNLFIQKRVSGGTVLGAFIGVTEMFHAAALSVEFRTRLNSPRDLSSSRQWPAASRTDHWLRCSITRPAARRLSWSGSRRGFRSSVRSLRA